MHPPLSLSLSLTTTPLEPCCTFARGAPRALGPVPPVLGAVQLLQVLQGQRLVHGHSVIGIELKPRLGSLSRGRSRAKEKLVNFHFPASWSPRAPKPGEAPFLRRSSVYSVLCACALTPLSRSRLRPRRGPRGPGFVAGTSGLGFAGPRVQPQRREPQCHSSQPGSSMNFRHFSLLILKRRSEHARDAKTAKAGEARWRKAAPVQRRGVG